MSNTGFIRWINPDATAEVICLCCFQIIASTDSRTEMLAEQDLHTCNPLKEFVTPQPDPLHGLYG